MSRPDIQNLTSKSRTIYRRTIKPEDFHHLCSLCAQIIRESRIIKQYINNVEQGPDFEEVVEEVFPFHTCPYLQTSAQSGCHLCSLLWKSLDEEDWLCPTTRFKLLVLRDIVAASGDLQLQLGHTKVPLSGSKRLTWRCQKTLWMEDGRYNNAPRQVSPLSPWHLCSSTGSEAVLDLARKWLRECLSAHPECSVGIASIGERPELPTRLLDIGNENGIVRLHDCLSDDAKRLDYICLSHVWGKGATYRLTRNTIAAFTKGIKIARLPKTFQDAIHITKALGYTFIWIDSLCIVQDSKEDWASEAARMASIYGNAVCTIAATKKGSQSGCFVDRNPLSLHACRLLSTSTLYASTDPYFARRRWSPLGSPIFRRGWTFQECILSQRTIYFGMEQIWWECSTTVAGEACSDGYHANRRSSDLDSNTVHGDNDFMKSFRNLTNLRKTIRSGSRNVPLNADDDSIGRHWQDIVGQYSQRDLTYDSDKLIALQGVAAAFRPSIGRTLGGLIEQEMIAQLSWYAYTEKASPTKAHFPSWSWSSVTGEISFYVWEMWKGDSLPPWSCQYIRCDEDRLADVSRPIGPQKLVLRSHLKKVRWEYRDKGWGNGDVPVNIIGLSEPIRFRTLLVSSDQDTWLLLLGTGHRERGGFGDFGLVLTVADDQNYFRRVGLFTGDRGENCPLQRIADFFKPEDIRTVVIC